MAIDPLLDHLEKTFADAYRKEIDQEENVWRSLPFFAATLALQLTALAQIREWIAGVSGPLLVVATVLLCLAGAATLAAIALLAFSVWPADFQYVGREPAFQDYAEIVRAQVAVAAHAETEEYISERALRTVKAALCEQYATAVDCNRLINQGRAKWRTRAGLATLTSVFAVLVLVSLIVVSNIYESRRDHGPDTGRGARPASNGELRPTEIEQRPSTADAGGSQGLVERQSDGATSIRISAGTP